MSREVQTCLSALLERRKLLRCGQLRVLDHSGPWQGPPRYRINYDIRSYGIAQEAWDRGVDDGVQWACFRFAQGKGCWIEMDLELRWSPWLGDEHELGETLGSLSVEPSFQIQWFRFSAWLVLIPENWYVLGVYRKIVNQMAQSPLKWFMLIQSRCSLVMCLLHYAAHVCMKESHSC